MDRHLTQVPYNSEGRRIATEGIVRDISLRKHAEEAQRRLTAILEATTDFVGVADMARHPTYLNRAGRRLLGIGDEEDISSATISDYYPEGDAREVLEQAILTAIHEGAWGGESVLLHRDGRAIPVSQVVMAHHGPEGTIEYLSTVARDIRERLRVEEQERALAVLEEREQIAMDLHDGAIQSLYAVGLGLGAQALRDDEACRVI